MSALRRWAAAVLAVAGILVLAGVGWALLASAGLLYASVSLDPAVVRVWARVRALVASWAAQPVTDRASMALVAVGVLAVGVGLAVWLHPGAGVLAAGLAAGGIGLRLERWEA